MSTPNNLRRLARRNARLLAAADLPPAPKDPTPTTRGRLDGNGRLQRANSVVERKRVAEDVGCTISTMDYLAGRRMKAVSERGTRGRAKVDHQVGRWMGTMRPGDTRLRKN